MNKKQVVIGNFKVSGWEWELNPRPERYKGSALPIELSQQVRQCGGGRHFPPLIFYNLELYHEASELR